MRLSEQEYYLSAIWFTCLLGCVVNPEAWMVAVAVTFWYTAIHVTNKIQLIGGESTEQKRNSRKAFLQMM